MKVFKVAILGCGAIGRKRATAVRALGHDIVACGDLMADRSHALAKEFGTPDCYAADDRSVLSMHGHGGDRVKPDIVICASLHDTIVQHAWVAVRNGCHVLIEKPGARCSHELQKVKDTTEVRENEVKVLVGYNLRHHPAVVQALNIAKSGKIGKILFFRGRYGHGGRVGYESEWRCSPKKSGGGVAMDMAVHLIDLFQFFTGLPPVFHTGVTSRDYWESEVEDNVLLRVTNTAGQWAAISASWTEWKNIFNFEVVGETGKLEISGIGGSYGIERLIHHQMGPLLGPPHTTIQEWALADYSWVEEFQQFIHDINMGRNPASGLDEAINVLQVVEALYKQNGNVYV